MVAPAPLSFWHPASLLATWFGCGLLPRVPGTWGALAALPLAYAIVSLFGQTGLIAAAVLFTAVGVWAGDAYARGLDTKDPNTVVIDEVVGQWIAVVPIAFEPTAYPIAFLFFRVLDIVKVWPANVFEARLKGGWGIMADDVMAGLYAAGVTAVVVELARPA